MGIRKRVKKLILPIIGGGKASPPPDPALARRRPVPVYQEEEEELSPRGDAEPRAWIEKQIADHPVVLFMKGSPDAPACGFSANATAILRSTGRPFQHVNILLDPDVRSDVKTFSGWPTIPQLYIGGEFMGGSDILTEMNGNGELKEALDAAFPEADAKS